MGGGDGMRGEKSMSIMNTQHSNKEKCDPTTTQRSLTSVSDNNRQLPTYQNTSLSTSITSNVTANSSNTNSSSNSSNNTIAVSASNTLDTSISDSHVSISGIGNTTNPVREPK